tara:strand:- start:475 stop:939 length:465 start_codon:yes stop_codon:yes gene_type:complete
MYHVDIHSEAEDWLKHCGLFEEAVSEAEGNVGIPDDLHDDVEEPEFQDSTMYHSARDAAVEAVADAIHDDINEIIESYLNTYRDGYIAEAVGDAVESDYQQWHDDVIDESKDLVEQDEEEEEEEEEENDDTLLQARRDENGHAAKLNKPEGDDE